MKLARLFSLFALCVLMGCQQPLTQVIVIVDADNAIRAMNPRIKVRVWGPEGAGADRRPLRDVWVQPGVDVSWPFRLVLTPLEGDSTRRYEVHVTAARTQEETVTRDPRDPIVTLRAISGYAANETRVLRMSLESGCITEYMRCEGMGETCRGMMCVPVLVPVPDLPPLSSYMEDAGPRDASIDVSHDTASDAWSASDAGVDAYVEPGVDADIDAYVAPDIDANTSMDMHDAFTPTDAFTRSPFSTVHALVVPTGPLTDLGQSVAVSDHHHVAVGAPAMAMSDGYIYTYTGMWGIQSLTPSGADICGANAAINAEGTVAAFGCPGTNRVIVWEHTGGWTQHNIAPAGLAPTAQFGSTIAMNAAGTRIAIATPGSTGTIYIYDRVEMAWSQSAMFSGGAISLSMSDDGTLLAAGTGDTVFTLALDGGTTAAPILGDSDNNFGASVALSGDGTTLVVGAPATTMNTGRAFFYRREGMNWRMRATRDGVSNGVQLGSDVATNRDGTRFAVSARAGGGACSDLCSTTTFGVGSGAVYVYNITYDFESYIRPPAMADPAAFGESIAMSRDGMLLAIGAPDISGGGGVYIVE